MAKTKRRLFTISDDLIRSAAVAFEVWLRERYAMPKKKTPKPTVKKAHKIARRIAKTGGVRNPWAVGMATAKKSARKRKAKRSKR